MPKQNRPLIRDGRLEVKKRTDRSYLRPATRTVDDAEPDIASSTAGTTDLEPAEDQMAAAVAQPVRAPRAVGSARALQQQGVRKRREFDIEGLAQRDTAYAYHELRRIAVLAALVVITLIVLAVVMR